MDKLPAPIGAGSLIFLSKIHYALDLATECAKYGPMLITRRLRLLSPLLAVKHSNKGDGRRQFVKIEPPEGCAKNLTYISSQLPRWNWAFLEARDALELDDVAVSAIMPGRFYAVKRTSTYNRNVKVRGRLVRDKYEAVSSGQVLEMQFTLSKHIPPNTDGDGRFTKTPSEEEFDAMLSHIGEHLGISEWGHAYQYGRFEIQPSEFNQNKNTNEGKTT